MTLAELSMSDSCIKSHLWIYKGYSEFTKARFNWSFWELSSLPFQQRPYTDDYILWAQYYFAISIRIIQVLIVSSCSWRVIIDSIKKKKNLR